MNMNEICQVSPASARIVRFRRRTATAFCLSGLLAVLATVPVQADDFHLYKAARIWTGSAPVYANGALLVRDGKVVAAGKLVNGKIVSTGNGAAEVAVPADAQVHDLGSSVIIPGLVIGQTTLGERGRDDERALTPEFQAVDGFDFYGDFSKAIAGGVTTVQIAPGSDRLMPGQGSVVKLAGADPIARVLRERESLRVQLGDAFKNPPRIFEPPVGAVSVEKPLEPTRRQLANSLASATAGLRATFRAAKEYGVGQVARGEKDPALAAVATYLKPGSRVRITAPGDADIRAALTLANEFQLHLVLVDPANVAHFRDQLPKWKDRVDGFILNAEIRPGAIRDIEIPDSDDPKKRLPWDNARDLLKAGHKVAIRPASDADLEDSLFTAGLFLSGGLSTEKVIQMMTSYPAEILGVADRVGSLTPGKDADFVVLDGEPFGTHTRINEVFVEGKSAYANKPAAKAMIVQARSIYTGAGTVINNGSILVDGGKVRGLGRDVSAPADALVRKFDRGVIVPGFIDLSTGLGLGGPLTSQVALNTRLGERLVSGDQSVGIARQGGVTTVLLSSTASGTGPVVAFKLGDKPHVVQDPVAIRFSVSGNLTSQGASLRSTLQAAKAYADSFTKFEAAQAEYVKKKAEYDAAKAKAPASAAKPAAGAGSSTSGSEKKPETSSTTAGSEKKPGTGSATASTEKKPEEPKEPTAPEKPRVNEALEPYRALFAGKIPALVEAKRTDAIKLAVQIFREEFKLRTILLGAEDAFRIPNLLAEKDVSVAVGPEMVQSVQEQTINTAQVLANRGIPFSFQSRATTGVKMLPLAVQYAVRCGLGAEDALNGLTSGPAKLLSIEGRVGTLGVGRDADLVVLSGPPFESSTRVLAVMIDGQWVFQEEDER
jgi:imidazolonepropionase-like amidohydrolase